MVVFEVSSRDRRAREVLELEFGCACEGAIDIAKVVR